MLLGNILLRDDTVVLVDVDGSEVTLSIEDILTIRSWVMNHYLDLTIAQHHRDERMSSSERTQEAPQEEA